MTPPRQFSPRAAFDNRSAGESPGAIARADGTSGNGADAGSCDGYLIIPSAGSGPAPTPPAATSWNPMASPATDAAPAGISMSAAGPWNVGTWSVGSA